jgi:hypothetical protein
VSDILAAVIAGVAAFVGAGLGAVVTLRTARAAEVEAGREEWYRRFQYVANLLLTGNERSRSAGIGLLHVLLADPHAGPTEQELAASLLGDVVHSGAAGHALAAVGVSPGDLVVSAAAATGAAHPAAEVTPGWSRLRWTAVVAGEPGAAVLATAPAGSVPVLPDQVRAARELLVLRGAAGVHPVVATIAWLRETP